MHERVELRTLWLAVILLTATMIGVVGGILAWLGGMNPPMAVIAGAGAFVTGVMLALRIWDFTTRHVA